VNHQKVIVVDFGGQYNQLIARRVREENVFCEIISYKKIMDYLKTERPAGMILTGGPNSAYLEGAPSAPKEFFEMGIPILGICYGAQLMAHVLGGKVKSPDFKEYGRVGLTQGAGTGKTAAAEPSPLFKNVDKEALCWMSHTDYIENVPEGFQISSFTDNCPTASMEDRVKKLYAVQFHPEVHHTPFGQQLLRNFLYEVCGCTGDWTMASFAKTKIEEIRNLVGDRKVLCALSGGVDSSVAAMLVHKAIGDNLTCVFVDHGLLRKDEGDQVVEVYGRQFNMNIIRVNAQERFLGKLAGVSEPEKKRKIIGEEFIRVFEAESKRLYEQEGENRFSAAGNDLSRRRRKRHGRGCRDQEPS
jgi:GMP synthase (glutamine-hydrolysing)